MKKIFLLLLFISCQAFAQNLEVRYFENPRISQTEIDKLPEFIKKDFLPNRFSYTLKYSNGISYYQHDDFLSLFADDDTVYEEDNAIIDGESTTFRGKVVYDKNSFKSKEKTYYKELVNKKIYYTENGYHVIDEPIDWQWKITDETSEIAGYICRKAVSNFMGGTFEAWYAEDIAINAGPDKFDGLPGLILFVRTSGMETIAQSVKNLDDPVTFEKPVFEGKIYTFEELYTNPQPTTTQPTAPQSVPPNSRRIIIKSN